MLAQHDLSRPSQIVDDVLFAAQQQLASGSPSSGRLIAHQKGQLLNFGTYPAPCQCSRDQNQVRLMQHFFVETAQELHLTFFSKEELYLFVLDLGDNDLTYTVLQELVQAGFYTQLVVWPLGVAGRAYLGVGLNENLTFQDIEELLYTVQRLSNYTYRVRKQSKALA
jgi:hypothetical protein